MARNLGGTVSRFGGVLALSLLLGAAGSDRAPLGIAPAEARPWAKNPVDLARDYLTIVDNRAGGELVMLFWMAPPMAGNTTAGAPAAELLDHYVMLGAVRSHTAPGTGEMSFDKIPDLRPSGADGKSLNPLDTMTMPPAMAGMAAALQSGFARALGPLGRGTQWFVFEAGAVHACGRGMLSVPLAGETYTFQTPIPGCPSA